MPDLKPFSRLLDVASLTLARSLPRQVGKPLKTFPDPRSFRERVRVEAATQAARIALHPDLSFQTGRGECFQWPFSCSACCSTGGVKVLQGMLRAGLGVEYFSRNENDAFYEVVQAGVDH